jgi:hypothetical protein
MRSLNTAITASAIGAERIHDRRAGVVVEAIAIGIEARRIASDPIVEQIDDLHRGRSAPSGMRS